MNRSMLIGIVAGAAAVTAIGGVAGYKALHPEPQFADVLAVEPPRDGNPLLDLDLPNFILTPHVAWSSREAMQALADQVVDNIDAFVAGTPRNVVT